ncbi:hypothetical protein QBC38DRAFT_478521 [Podospora fimiseda]|uniref:Uncharacterized protein n=1 Tax=Podospora fimiseda TaxID=252190 RepID=A0AAN7GUC4_9PEZI|nr:hypothetical protein QBC38DRAFT_478521 [Podospora fimiseda]
MASLVGTTGYIVGASFIGVTLIPVVVTWVFSLMKVVIAPNSKQIKIARLLVQCALPVFALAIILGIANRGLLASGATVGDGALKRTRLNLEMTSIFLFFSASLLTAMAAYLATYAVLYLALSRWKWWPLIQLDSSIGGGLVGVMIIAWYAKNMSDLSKTSTSYLRRNSYSYSLDWLSLIIECILLIVALGLGGVAIYAVGRLKKPDRAHLIIGKIPVALLAASFLWFLRCIYCVAVGIKGLTDGWTIGERAALNVVFPIFELWTMVAVLALVVYIARHRIWSDPTAIPNIKEPRAYQMPVVAAQAPVIQYVYVQQPPPQPYVVAQQPPQMFQPAPVYQQGQPPVIYQTQPYSQQPIPQQPVQQQPIPVQPSTQ